MDPVAKPLSFDVAVELQLASVSSTLRHRERKRKAIRCMTYRVEAVPGNTLTLLRKKKKTPYVFRDIGHDVLLAHF